MQTQQHWNNIYSTKVPEQLSWTQEVPALSLQLIQEQQLPKDAPILDAGGGDSRLVDFLLNEGYSDITVLDIAEEALQKSKARLGEKARQVNWIAADVTNFSGTKEYMLWHDRAVFHFLTTDAEAQEYIQSASGHLASKGKMILGTFSDKGPEKCSGLPVKRYSEEQLADAMKNSFSKIRCLTQEHHTPWGALQQFTFCSFNKISS